MGKECAIGRAVLARGFIQKPECYYDCRKA